MIQSDLRKKNNKQKSLNSSIAREGHERLYQLGLSKIENQKINEMTNFKEVEELQKCTFKPEIIAKNNFGMSRRRSMEEFYNDQIKQIDHKQEVRGKHLQQDELEYEAIQSSLKNVTSQTSRYYQKTKRSFNLERSKSREKDTTELTFHPKINKKSQHLQRSGSVNDILYEDAQNRMKKQSSQKDLGIVKNNQVYILNKSEKFLIDKLNRELDEVF